MTRMVEKMAMAMWDARPDRQPARVAGLDLNSWEAALPREREAAYAMARAVIAVLMEPDERMLEAGSLQLFGGPDLRVSAERVVALRGDDAEACLQAMLKAVLEE